MSRPQPLKVLLPLVIAALALAAGAGGSVTAQTAAGTAFTYQGQLTQSGSPVTGTCDFQFALYDAATAGSQVGSTLNQTLGVDGGLFIALLDFGDGSWSGGEQRWIEISVRCPAGSGGYTTLTPRQEIAPAPYAIWAAHTPWTGITSMPAGFADDVDNDTTYTVGAGLVLTGTQISADTSYLQRRVSSCVGYQSIVSIAADGSVTCRNTITGLDATDTISVNAPFPLDNGDWSVEVKPASISATHVISSQVQLRASGTCAAGSSIRVINADGTVTCETDDDSGGDITGVTAGTGLSGGGTSGPVTVSADTTYLQRRVSSTCAVGTAIRAVGADGTVTCSSTLWARVYNTVNITPTHNSWTVLTFNAERFDTDTIHSTASNTSRLTATTAGVYVITAQAQFAANGTGTRALAVKLNANGSSASGSWLAFESRPAHASDPIHIELTTQYQLAAGDYVEVFAWQNSGGNLAVQTSSANWPEFSMTRLP